MPAIRGGVKLGTDADDLKNGWSPCTQWLLARGAVAAQLTTAACDVSVAELEDETVIPLSTTTHHPPSAPPPPPHPYHQSK